MIRAIVALCATLAFNVLATAGRAAAAEDPSSTSSKLIVPTVRVTPSSSNITRFETLTVSIVVSSGKGDSTPGGSVKIAGGRYSSAATALSRGSAKIVIPAEELAAGSDTLIATYTPNAASAAVYAGSSGETKVVVTKIVPAVAVTASTSSITTEQNLTVSVAVKGGAGKPTPAGTVKLTSGSYSSYVKTLVDGTAQFEFPGHVLSAGRDELIATYTPEGLSAANYESTTGEHAVTVTKIATSLSATVSSASITTIQPWSVSVAVHAAGSVQPEGSVSLTGGTASITAPVENGVAQVQVPAGSLPGGSDVVLVAYTPQGESAAIFNGASTSFTESVAKVTPAVTVTPSSLNIVAGQALTATVSVDAGKGAVTPDGFITLIGGGYTSPATALVNGSAAITIPSASLTVGRDTFTASYAPESSSTGLYNPASGTSAAVSIASGTLVSVDLSSPGPAVTDKILGMNMAAWFDITNPVIVTAFHTAGIQAIRWPGGSWSDDYHWASNALCSGTPNSNDTFANVISDLVTPAAVDIALTADYGTNAACNGPGDPTEAAAWITNAKNNGIAVSHMTVGNEEYGDWETDNHTSQHDPTTYADAVAGSSGYYKLIKAADSNTLVGVDVSPGYNWDETVLANAPYDFVEYHYYPQAPGQESDTYLVHQAANDLTTAINTIKSELSTAGKPDTPIYVGEIGSVYTDPGKQSTSITQALYAGQVLGEMMNDGISRATWWIGFGGCNDAAGGGNFSSSLYGWQNFGGYMVFSDGTPEYGCYDATPVPEGTLLPTARAFQLFSSVAVSGETVLTTSVTGDATDIRAYAATSSGGTALVLFNLNETASEEVAVSLSGKTTSSGVSVETYSKAIYDQSQNNVWAPPITTSLGAQSLPLALSLDPWSMNVVIIK